MIIGGSKTKVIENIKQALLDNDLNRKVEENDASLSQEEEAAAVTKFYALRKKSSFRLKHAAMQKMNDLQMRSYDKLIEVRGQEKLSKLDSGFIITSNHFNPLDNLCIKKACKVALGVEPYIVIQATNLVVPGVIGELFNYLDHIPIRKSASYIRGEFLEQMKEVMEDQKRPVLIYPEEEMWFNYRKPRPNKRGAFHFAATLKVPVVPCFVEILDTSRPDNEEFFESEYIVHILDPIYPDITKSVRQNSVEMAERDYALKKAAYEKAYGKKLDYKFEESDVANYRGN